MTGWTPAMAGGRAPGYVKARLALMGEAVMVEGVEVLRV